MPQETTNWIKDYLKSKYDYCRTCFLYTGGCVDNKLWQSLMMINGSWECPNHDLGEVLKRMVK